MWYLFPIKPGTKEPAFKGWQKQSSCDPVQIEKWRDEGYDLGVDCEKSDIGGVDLDGLEGLATGAGMDLPPTYTMQTPRGGKHFYYRGTCPSSVKRLGPGVDTRGIGGYLIWEGDGYGLIDERELAPLPNWITPALNVRKDRKASTGVSLNLQRNINRSLAYLSVRRPAIEGEGGNGHTYETAAALRDLGVSAECALELLLEKWNERCLPPWDSEELGRVVDNAYQYGQNEEGAQALDFDPLTRFAGVAAAPPAEPQDDPFKPWKPSELLLRPPPEWLFPGIIPKESVGALIAPSDSGKTFFAIHCGLVLATGIEGMGRAAGPPRHVIYIPMEGSRDISHNRLPAWQQKHGVSQDLMDHFRVVENFPDVLDGDRVARLIQRQRDEGLDADMLIVDTYGRAMGEADLDENKANEVRRFIRQMEQIKRLMGCTELMIHHTSKAGDAAGSYALKADSDFWMNVETNWDVQAMAVTCGKMKGAARFNPLYFEVQPTQDSLTIEGILPNEYKALTQVDDDLSQRSIQIAMANVKAYGDANAVTPYVLASHIYKSHIGEPQMEIEAKWTRIARKITALGKTRDEHLVGPKGHRFPTE